MKKIFGILILLIFATLSIMAQDKIDQEIVVEKYNKVSNMKTLSERRKFLTSQTYEMRTALWKENIRRKTEGIDLTKEQIEIINLIREKFVTVEYAKSVKGKNEADAGKEYHEIMGRANKLLGRKLMGELFGILGDSENLEMK